MNRQTLQAIELVKIPEENYFLAAYEFAKVWVQNTFKPFSSEDMKEAFYKKHEPPREPRVWGAVVLELSKAGLISHHGFQKYKNPAGHGKPSSVWISKEYSLLQSSNSRSGRNQISLF